MKRGKLVRAPGIYTIESIGTGRIYVGSSVNVGRRRCEHLSDLRLGVHGNAFLQRHYDKHGAEDLRFWIVELCGARELINREQYWMDELLPEFNGPAPRATALGRRHSEQSKKKMSKVQTKRLKNPELRERLRQAALVQFSNPANRKRLGDLMRIRSKEGRHPTLGRRHSEESKRCISAARVGKGCGERNFMYGKRHSKETRQKIRDAVGDQSGVNNPMYGRRHSEETKAKMRSRSISQETRDRMSQAQKNRFAKHEEQEK